MPSASDFDANYYLSLYPDVAASGMNPLQHFQQFGIAENRAPNQSVYNAATANGIAAPGSDAYNFNMNNGAGGLLADYGSSYLHANPDVFAAVQSGQYSSALDHYQKNGQAEGRNWGTGYTTALDPKTGAATFGGPAYANTLKIADGVSGYNGTAATGGRPATGAASGGPFSMAPQQQQQNPFGNFDFDGYLSGLTNKFNSSLQGMTSQFDSWKNGMAAGSGFGTTTDGVNGTKPATPTYSPQSRNGYGSSWTNNNPFKIGSF